VAVGATHASGNRIRYVLEGGFELPYRVNDPPIKAGDASKYARNAACGW